MSSLTSMGRVIAALLLAVVYSLPSYAHESDVHDPDCRPADGAHFLCGVMNVETLVRVDGTRWGVGSSASGPVNGAPVYFFDLERRAAYAVDPTKVPLTEDFTAYPGCPGPADFSNLGALSVTYAVVKGRPTLFVVSHGGRFSIQVFEVKFGRHDHSVPTLSWLGCVLPPNAHFWPDAIAVLPDGGMLVTSVFDPLDSDVIGSMLSGRPYGSLGEWHAATGWTEVYPNTLASPNGILVSSDKDARMLFVANYSGKRVTRIDRLTGAKTEVQLPMLVDNLTWNEKGTKFFAGGQTDGVAQSFACFGSASLNCDGQFSVHFSIYEIDPVTMVAKHIIGPTMLGVMGGGTGALQYGNDLWITTLRGDRVARIKYPHSSHVPRQHGF